MHSQTLVTPLRSLPTGQSTQLTAVPVQVRQFELQGGHELAIRKLEVIQEVQRTAEVQLTQGETQGRQLPAEK